MAKRPSYYAENLPKLIALCDSEGYQWEFVDRDEYQVRVYGATYVIDIWPSRMVYHRVKGETIDAVEPYYDDLSQRFNVDEVRQLLATGKHKAEPVAAIKAKSVAVAVYIDGEAVEVIDIVNPDPREIQRKMSLLGNRVKDILT